MLIEFDPDKDRANLAKHGISLALAEQIDIDEVLSFTDPRDYGGEIRHIGFAPVHGQIYCFWFTWRGAACRVIGIRKASTKEAATYHDQHR